MDILKHRRAMENALVAEGLEHSFVDLVGRAIKTETSAGHLLGRERVGRRFGPAADNFTADDAAQLPLRYRQYASQFVGLTQQGVEARKRNIDEQLETREAFDEVGMMRGFGAQLVALVFDPINFVPLAGPIAKGASLGTKIRRGAKAGVVGGAAVEAVLLPTQETRTATDAAINVGASAVTAAAKALRHEVLAPLLKEAQSVGLLPENLTTKTALSYFTRSWNQQALSQNQQRFLDVTSRYLREGTKDGTIRSQDNVQAELSAAETRLREATDIPEGEVTTIEIQGARKELASLRREASTYPNRPVIDFIIDQSGIRPGSPAALELEAQGVTKRNAPNLFKETGMVDELIGDDAGGIGEGTVGAGARMLPFANHPGIKQYLRYFAVPALKDQI